MKINRKAIKASDEIIEEVEEVVEPVEEEVEVEVDPAATDLLFEAEDVAELLAEATGEDVEVTVSEDGVDFAIGEDVLTATPEGDEEILEASTRMLKGKKVVKASKKAVAKKAPVKASRKVARRVIKK